MFTTLSTRLNWESTDDLRIDRHLPTYHTVSRRHIVVDAAPEEVYEAMLAADLTDLGLVVWLLGKLRVLPSRLAAMVRGTSAPPEPASFTLGDLPRRGDWVRLDDTPGEEFVFGAIGAVWRPDIEWVDLDATAFRDFDAPGYAKIAAGFSFRPYGRDRTLVTYEARTFGTDDTARRRFQRYWTLVGPFVGYILGSVLMRLKADVDATQVR